MIASSLSSVIIIPGINFLISSKVVHAKNYEITSKFVKVKPRILVASFFPGTVYR